MTEKTTHGIKYLQKKLQIGWPSSATLKNPPIVTDFFPLLNITLLIFILFKAIMLLFLHLYIQHNWRHPPPPHQPIWPASTLLTPDYDMLQYLPTMPSVPGGRRAAHTATRMIYSPKAHKLCMTPALLPYVLLQGNHKLRSGLLIVICRTRRALWEFGPCCFVALLEYWRGHYPFCRRDAGRRPLYLTE